MKNAISPICVYYWRPVVSFKLAGFPVKLRCQYASNKALVWSLTSELEGLRPTTFVTQTDNLTSAYAFIMEGMSRRWFNFSLSSLPLFCVSTTKCNTIQAFKVSHVCAHYPAVACFFACDMGCSCVSHHSNQKPSALPIPPQTSMNFWKVMLSNMEAYVIWCLISVQELTAIFWV